MFDSPQSLQVAPLSQHRYSVFISHRERDLHIAKMVKDHLTKLSRGKLDVYVSREMPAGTNFRVWIKNNIDRADFLIFILTDKQSLTPWCSYELGRFLQKVDDNNNGNKRFICIMNPQFASPPPPIDPYQGISADCHTLENFYNDLLAEGKYTNNIILTNNDQAFFNGARQYAKELADAMSPVHSTDHFFGRITITFLENNKVCDNPKVRVEDDGAKNILEIMGCSVNARTLSELKEPIKNSPVVVWIEQLEEHILKGGKLPPLAPFHDSLGTTYIPVPSRLEKIDDKAAEVEILLVVAPDALRECLELERRLPQAIAQFEVIKLLRMGRRFRYDIVEPWIGELGARVSPDELKERSKKYLTRLRNLEREGQEEKFRSYTFAADILGLESEDRLKEIWSEYYKIDIKSIVEEMEIEKLKSALETYRSLNKTFMLIALESYMRKVESCRPHNVKRPEVIANAFGVT